MPRLLLLLVGIVLGVIGTFYLPRLLRDAPIGGPAREVAILKEENNRLRGLVEEVEKTKVLARNKVLREEIEREVVAIRGLPFKTPVDYQLLDRQEIKATVAGKLAEVFSETDFINMTAALARLGLLESGYPLREKYIDLLGEQVAAFYDQHQHKLVMFEDATLENSQNRVVLAHELAHALQDQHFGLKKLPLEIKTNDDRAAAASALCEGDATLVMTEYMLKKLSLSTLKDTFASTMAQNMEQLAKAPRYLREMLIFPYLRGQEFCAALYANGGYAAINKAYLELPGSTAEILHPEKYVSDSRTLPTEIKWADLQIRGQAPIADNVLGEYGIRILFTEWLEPRTAEKAANGWMGDRYLSYEKGEALVWKSVWTDADEGAQFIEAGKATLAKRYAKEPSRVVQWLTPRPGEVVLIDASTAEWATELATRFGQ